MILENFSNYTFKKLTDDYFFQKILYYNTTQKSFSYKNDVYKFEKISGFMPTATGSKLSQILSVKKLRYHPHFIFNGSHLCYMVRHVSYIHVST